MSLTGGTLSLAGGDLAVQSPDIILGTAPGGRHRHGARVEHLWARKGLRNLLLASSSSIDLYGSVVSAARAERHRRCRRVARVSARRAMLAALSATKTFTLANSQGNAASGSGTGAGCALDQRARHYFERRRACAVRLRLACTQCAQLADGAGGRRAPYGAIDGGHPQRHDRRNHDLCQCDPSRHDLRGVIHSPCRRSGCQSHAVRYRRRVAAGTRPSRDARGGRESRRIAGRHRLEHRSWRRKSNCLPAV